MEKFLKEGNQTNNFKSSSGFGTVINYGSDFLTNYGSGSTCQKVTVPTVPVPEHWASLTFGNTDLRIWILKIYLLIFVSYDSVKID
jgi:hypothetical protein